MPDSSNRTTIIVAIIGVIGSIIVAIISNWDKFTDSPQFDEITYETPLKNKPHTINIAGHWHDPNRPSDVSHINQQGNLFQFNGSGILPQGIRFESTGSGTINEQEIKNTYTTRYQNGLVAHGTCSGTVSSNGLRSTSTCTDNVWGTFTLSGVRD